MVSCDNIKASSDTEEFANWQWGACNSSYDSNSIYETLADGTKKGLSIDGDVTTIYNVPDITNLRTLGLELPDGSSTSYITEESLRDYTDKGLANNMFKAYDADVAIGDGFAYNETPTSLNERKLDNDIALLAGNTYAEGDIVNSGYAKTLRVIAHRNNILRTGLSQVGLSPNTSHCHIPTGENFGGDELLDLATSISAIRAWAKGTGEGQLADTQYGNRWSQVYYPAASVCYAYEPTTLAEGEALNAKFFRHNWFLPTEGILARICYYTYDYSSGTAVAREESPLNTFAFQGKTLFKRMPDSGVWTSTESGDNGSWSTSFKNGNSIGNVKYSSYEVRAVAAF
jgi:hypothetical protein